MSDGQTDALIWFLGGMGVFLAVCVVAQLVAMAIEKFVKYMKGRGWTK